MAAPFRKFPAFATYSRVTTIRSYAKKIVSKVGAPTSQKAKLEVETDPEKLVTYCCGANIYVDGSDPEIKPDSEYPDWLFNMRVERGGQDLSEIDQDTPYYWRRLQRLTSVRNRNIAKRLQKLSEIQFPDK